MPSRREIAYDWSSRKFLVFAFSVISASYLLWEKMLPAEDYLQLVLWVTLMYFGANVWQKGLKVDTGQPVKVRLFSRKFVILLTLLMFFTFATMSGVLPPTQYTTLMIWMPGIYFGIDISEIYAFRGIRGLGHMFKDEADPTQNPYPPYRPPHYFGTEAQNEDNGAPQPEKPKDTGQSTEPVV